MRIRQLFVVFAAVVALAGIGVSSVAAQTEGDCGLAQLRAATVDAAPAFTNSKSFTSTLAKLDAAAAKIAEGKTADAAAKIRDYQQLLSSLANAPKPKLDPATASDLIAQAEAVALCLEGQTN